MAYILKADYIAYNMGSSALELHTVTKSRLQRSIESSLRYEGCLHIVLKKCSFIR